MHLTQHLAAADAMTAPHRLVLLKQSTGPATKPGALKAVACAGVAWIRKASRPHRARRPAHAVAV